jgi:uncharacterized protein YceH (UPF0502 family)
LTADEARVIGVLIEKAQTTPDQYPLTINAVVNGANQKNNRDPVTNIDDGAALSALIGLRNKALVVQQDAPGQRAPRFRHQFKEGLGVNTPEMVVLAELLLRGPQTLGELRGRASRMHPIESLDMAKNILQQLMDKPQPLVLQIAPAPGSRAERYVQLLCPELHEIVEGAEGAPLDQTQRGTGSGAAAATVGERVARLEGEVAMLREALSRLAAEIGASDPFAHREGEAPSEPSSSSGGHAS